MNERMEAGARLREFERAFLTVAETKRLASITSEDVAHAAKVSPSLVRYHAPPWADFRRSMCRLALEERKLVIIGQALVLGWLDPQDMSTNTRRAAIQAASEADLS